ncbi:GSCOCG00011351001-RA-CDS [Cotesia congregata]|nr:GSCOCG00011351001-RA-CDS [Cotesia congregata]
MEENLEDRIHPVHVEESNENNENTGSEIEDYFSDSSEEFSDAERIENSTYENEVESNRHHEDNSNIDSSDSDFEDTSGLNNPFFSVNTPTFSFPFISKPNLTENDHLLAILAISARNNFSFEAMLSIFTWMKITHTNNNLPTTKKALWKVLHRDDTLIKRHLYCGVCKEHIGVGKKPSKTCTCESCGPDKKSVDARYFLQLSLKSQLNEFFKIPNIDKSLQYRFTREKRDLSAIEDIFDGRFYQNLSLPGNFLDNPLNFSFAMNTDGCQVAKSSKASAWPVYLQFNELPPHLRKKHMLLAGIFVDVSHPSLNLVLDPMIKELRELYTTGILWRTSDGREVRSKFVVTTCIVDSPARSLILRMKQFNGYYGCTFCYAKGEHQKHKHVYPRTDWSTNLRTDEEMRRDMLAAYETKTIINGIKGISALSGLPEFDLANGLAVDSLHAVFLGAVKQHTNLFFTATDSPYYVGDPTSKAMIDKRLLSIKPPSRRARLPRSVETFNNWKGSELRNWLDYASPCLDGILHSKYIKHLALLAQAVHYLNSDSITAANLEKAAHLLEKYISQFEELFGLENMSYNLHLFAHLIITIKNLGPMWVNNASTYESWNKKIMDKVTSPHERAVQVVMQFLMTKFVESAIYSDSISTETKKFICNILKIPNLSEEIVINKDFQVVSSPEIVRFQEVELTVLQEAGYHFHTLKLK